MVLRRDGLLEEVAVIRGELGHVTERALAFDFLVILSGQIAFARPCGAPHDLEEFLHLTAVVCLEDSDPAIDDRRLLFLQSLHTLPLFTRKHLLDMLQFLLGEPILGADLGLRRDTPHSSLRLSAPVASLSFLWVQALLLVLLLLEEVETAVDVEVQ